MRLLRVMAAYRQDKRMRFGSRLELERHQANRLEAFRRRLVARSPFYADLAHLPMRAWPEMNKREMLANFDTLNTAGLTLQAVFDTALAAEQRRSFESRLGGINVGLSSGTSGQRGVFAISNEESAQWAGVMLSRMLPDGIFAGERVALFLRANSNVYESVRSRWLSFRFFDLFTPFDENLLALQDYRASIIVAPAQVLRALALRVMAGDTWLHPKRVISVAEVLDPLDRALIEQAFPQVHEVYQATEGFLASTCEHGVLHLNEEYVQIEPQWLDAGERRFTPLITDFTRLTQPFVRHHLNDVLVARDEPCTCGRVTRALDAIEGRCDDTLMLPGKSGQAIAVFADLVSRVFAREMPRDADYRLRQKSRALLELHASIDPLALRQLQARLCDTLERLGVETRLLTWHLHTEVPPMDVMAKRRRIVRETHA